MAKLVATTYGDALFELAVEESKMDSLFEEAQVVIDSFKENEELGKLLQSPKIEKNDKEKTIENIFSRFVSKEMTGTLLIMIQKDRQNDIIATLEYFKDKVLEYKKVGLATVTTAKALDDKQKKAVLDKLLATTKYEDFNIDYIVDESLIGGIIIRIGDRVVDSSIKSKLFEMSKDLKKIQL